MTVRASINNTYRVRKGTAQDLPWANRSMQSFHSQNIPPCLVLEYNGKRIGIVGDIGSRTKKTKKDTLFVDIVEILSNYRRKGHGSIFLSITQRCAKTKGYNYIRTGRVPNPKSDNFWKKNGFKPIPTKNGSLVFEKQI